LVAAPSAMGLQHYKFGRVVSVPWVSESFAPKSVLDVIDGNLKEGLHTLLLLDLKEDGGFMTVSESLKTLKYLEERHRKDVIDDNTLVVGGARIGDRTEYIKGGRLRDLLEVDFGPPVHVVVIPGRLHFVEEEALMKIASVKEEEISHWRKRIDEKYKGLIPS
ncbi:MAG: diphthine synthase, partial [Thermoplasmata archaeon]|nr:diphthine synthase [Thermoplasmata archaeon]